MLTEIQLKTMLTLQNKMNKTVNPEWLTAGYGWHRAAMLEGAEGMEHHGWKWWKKQVCDLPQLQMEMIDIWHFALSAIIIEFNGDMELSAQTITKELSNELKLVIFDGKEYDFSTMELLDKLDLMIGLNAAKRFSVPLFISIIESCELTSDALYQQYVGKNVLNIFRQDNGYKEGSYVKMWHGREDNEYLVDTINKLDINDVEFSNKVYQGLQSNYPK